MRVLVTGANGFLGRTVCEALVRGGHSVTAAVRSPARAAGLPGTPVPIGDLADTTDWREALTDAGAVIHCAARVHVMRETARDPLAEFRSINVGATERLARAAAAGGVRRFLYVSSIKVNGEATDGAPFTAGDPAQPLDPYGISKHEAEQALWAIARETGLEVTVLRPPLVYGPGVGGNFQRLIKLVRSGAPLPLASVRNRRSMIYSRNFADLLVRLVADARGVGKTYVVADGISLSTPDLVRAIARSLQRSARLLPCPPSLLRAAAAMIGKADEIDRLVGSLVIDDTDLRRDLQWTAPYAVEDGIQETIDWYCSERT